MFEMVSFGLGYIGTGRLIRSKIMVLKLEVAELLISCITRARLRILYVHHLSKYRFVELLGNHASRRLLPTQVRLLPLGWL